MNQLINHYSACFVVEESHGVLRDQEPVTVGLPLPENPDLTEFGKFSWCVEQQNGATIDADIRQLSEWPNGSPKWVEITLLCSIAPNCKLEYVLLGRLKSSQKISEVRAPSNNEASRITFGEIKSELLLSFSEKIVLTLDACYPGNRRERLTFNSIEVLFEGKVRSDFRIRGTLGLSKRCKIEILITCFSGLGLLRLDATTLNEKGASHPGGFWDLGDRSSEQFLSLSLRIRKKAKLARCIDWQTANGGPRQLCDLNSLRIQQYSSGGVNWQSRVHLDKNRKIPMSQNGFEVRGNQSLETGSRASPVVRAVFDETSIQLAPVEFWQRFPSAVGFEKESLFLDVFPLTEGTHELQPGEQITKSTWVAIGGCSPTLAANSPLMGRPIQATLEASHALDWSISQKALAPEHEKFLTLMLDGGRNFEMKREAIDEYGWRNFGDIWADHEEPFADGEKPTISHYNNQYDILNGLLRAHLATGNPRLANYAIPLAKHILDIDLYNSTDDRAGFCGGYFWHTAHYLDADISSHRSYCTSMKFAKRHQVNGGGPGSNEHNYTSGLKLYYELTGDPRAKSAVIRLAEWVVAMDDGNRSALAPLSGAPTGKASSTTQNTYHGPGRGVGNSINCLLDAWQLTYEPEYINKCDELIRRVVHPSDDISRHNLLNAELRWSYTVCLQSLLKYLSAMDSRDSNMKAYVRDCLLHYGEWMLENELPYFENVAALEFPTETWHAQDLRKGNVLEIIAQLHPVTSKKLAMSKKGREIREYAWKHLLASETRDFSRPIALVLQQWPIFDYIQSPAMSRLAFAVNAIKTSGSLHEKTHFQPQKQVVKMVISSPSSFIKAVCRSLWLPHWVFTFKELAPFNKLRTRLTRKLRS